MTKHRYSEQQLRNAIMNARSIRQALINLGISSEGGNYRVIHKAIKVYNIDISHFTNQGWAKGKSFAPKRPLSDYIENNVPISSHKLRLRLLKENVFEHKCSSCSLESWLEKPIPLELDHKDGNHENNKLTNLRLLCPNCHALTSTYRGKNKSK
jgi:hypothetical protein